MINTMELKQKQRALLDQARDIEEKATSEGRQLTLREKEQSGDLLNQINFLGNQITTEERKQQAAMASASALEKKNIDLSDADRAFLSFVRKGVGGMVPDEHRALVEDTTGQYLVSPSVDLEIQRSLAKLCVIRQLASKRIINKDRIKVRDITEAQVGWGKLETGADITETTPVPAESTKYVEDLYGLVKIGEDELEDSDYNLTEYIADSFARAIAEKENLGFLKGAGHGSEQPEGITLDATLLAAAKTTDAANAVTIDDFLQCIYEVPVKYRQGSSWLVNSATELEIRKLRWDGGGGVGTGGYFWQPSLIEGAPPTFLGYPIYNQDDMDGLSSTGGVIAIFGNFEFGYRIIDRKEITILRLNELYAEAGLVGFISHFRTGGYVIKPSNKALVLLKESL